jgi:hypothetical protein
VNRKYVLGLAIGVAALLLVGSAIAFRGRFVPPSDPDKSAAPAPEIPLLKRKSRRGAAPIGFELQKPVQLLDFVDAKLDTVAGSWGFEEQSLLTSGVPWGRLQLPVVPPEEYELRLRAVRRGGTNSLNVGLVCGGAQVVLILDGWDKGDKAGLDRVGDKSFFENETTVVGHLLPQGLPVTLVCAVRKGSIEVRVEDRKIIGWQGDPKKLSLWPDWSVPEKRALFLGSWESSFEIQDLLLTPLGGPATLLR